MGWEVETELIADWVATLDDSSREQLYAALEILKDVGPNLGRPLVDKITNSRHSNMKELRPGSSGKTEIRVLFGFDIKREAILLLGGDKSGDWDRWYKINIPIADDLFDNHLREFEREIEMSMSLEELEARYPVNRANVEAHKARMLAEVRAYRLAELRKEQDLTQQQLADMLQVSQHRVSQIERGGTATAQIDTLRKYIEALGGKLSVQAEFGDHSFKVA